MVDQVDAPEPDGAGVKAPDGAGVATAAPWRVPVDPPRRVKLSAFAETLELLSLGFGLLLAVLCGGGLLALTLGDANLWNDVFLTLRGVPAKGTHIGNIPTETTVRGRPLYEVRFRFRDAAGNDHIASCATADTMVLTGLRARTDLDVRYDRRNPHRARVAGTRASTWGHLLLLPVGLALAGAVLAATALRRILSRRWLYVFGQEAPGTVTLVTQRPALLGDPPLRTHYTFESPGGEREGMTDDVVAPPEGAHVPVLFDPKRPERNLLPRPGAFET